MIQIFGKVLIMISTRFVNSIVKNMERLTRLGEDSLFISQFEGNENNKNANVIAILRSEDDQESLLKLRRLLLALKNKLEEKKGVEFNFELKRKKG